MKIKLLIVTREHAADQVYGLGRAIRRIGGGLESRGHKVIYCSAMDWKAADRDRFERVNARLNYILRYVGFGAELLVGLAERWVQGEIAAKRALEMNPTHVWFQDPWLSIGCMVYLHLHGWLRTDFRWGITEHGFGSSLWAASYDGLDLDQRTLALMLRLERRILRRADWVWTPSEAAMNQLCRDLGVVTPPSHWQTLGYGAPEPVKITKREARSLLGWDMDANYVLAIGRIFPVKRMHRLVEACAVAQRRLKKELRLVILGQGDLTKIEQAIHKTGFQPQILLVEDVTPYLAAADVYASASLSESFGLANQEAIGAGLPCLLACGGATCEIAGQGAWILDGSVTSFAEALSTILSDDYLLDFWRKRAECQRQQWPSWNDIIDETERRLLAIAK